MFEPLRQELVQDGSIAMTFLATLGRYRWRNVTARFQKDRVPKYLCLDSSHF